MTRMAVGFFLAAGIACCVGTVLVFGINRSVAQHCTCDWDKGQPAGGKP